VCVLNIIFVTSRCSLNMMKEIYDHKNCQKVQLETLNEGIKETNEAKRVQGTYRSFINLWLGILIWDHTSVDLVGWNSKGETKANNICTYFKVKASIQTQLDIRCIIKGPNRNHRSKILTWELYSFFLSFYVGILRKLFGNRFIDIME